MVNYIPTALVENYRNLTGVRYGRLTAMYIAGRMKDHHIAWMCKCDCGKEVSIGSSSLVRRLGGTKSCGCLRREVSSRPKKLAWNKGKIYTISGNNGEERVYKWKNGWGKAVISVKGNKCELCGWTNARCDVHHKIPLSKGGLNVISNGIVLCPNCHRIEHERGHSD